MVGMLGMGMFCDIFGILDFHARLGCLLVQDFLPKMRQESVRKRYLVALAMLALISEQFVSNGFGAHVMRGFSNMFGMCNIFVCLCNNVMLVNLITHSVLYDL